MQLASWNHPGASQFAADCCLEEMQVVVFLNVRSPSLTMENKQVEWGGEKGSKEPVWWGVFFLAFPPSENFSPSSLPQTERLQSEKQLHGFLHLWKVEQVELWVNFSPSTKQILPKAVLPPVLFKSWFLPMFCRSLCQNARRKFSTVYSPENPISGPSSLGQCWRAVSFLQVLEASCYSKVSSI